MNFYPFHIGDFAKSTAHLTWLESGAYRRLLDLYYSREAPLPEDFNVVCRLVVATQKSHRVAVEQVLHEFFEQTPNGWVHHRVERELIKMREKIDAADERKTNSSERMQRHRNLRKWYTDALHEVGFVAPFGIKIDELRQLYEAHCYGVDSEMQREHNGSEPLHVMAIPKTDPASIPEPRSKSVVKTKMSKSRGSSVATPTNVSPDVWRDFLILRQGKRLPLTQTALMGIEKEAEKAGVSLETALMTCCEAGWASFRADWFQNRNSPSKIEHGGYVHVNKQLALEASNRAIAESFIEEMERQDNEK